MLDFSEVVLCDTEFGTHADGRPDPRCAVFLELYSGKEIRLWADELRTLKALPFDTRNSLFVCYSAGAEIGVFLELGLPLPHHVCDLYAEHLAITNGRRAKKGPVKLVTLMVHYGLPPIDVEEKAEMRALAMRGGPYTVQEMIALLNYCASDVYALRDLLPRMAPDLARFHPQEILFRGRFMVALARSHRVGAPIDVPFVQDLTQYRSEMCRAIAMAAESESARAAEADPEHCHRWNIYDGARFDRANYKDFLRRAQISVPLTKTGLPTTAGEELEKLEGQYPQLTALRTCMGNIDNLRDFDVPVDADGRVRLFPRPFGTITGRSAKPGVFGLSKWMRPMIKPPRGYGVAYLDAKAQESLINGTLSGEPRMISDYIVSVGDVHTRLATELHLSEAHGQKPKDRAKVINHATNYGQGAHGLAGRLGISADAAAAILREHERVRPVFYRWRRSIVDGLKHRPARTYFTMLGWPFWVGNAGNNPRTMMNFPAQSHGADWMRVVMIAATEAGIEVCASAHDGFLILAPVERLEQDIAHMTGIMQAASEALFGVPMFVDCDHAVWPNRLVIGGKLSPTWELVQQEIAQLKQREIAA